MSYTHRSLTILTVAICGAIGSLSPAGEPEVLGYQLGATDGVMGDQFGNSVSIFNNIVAVGAPSRGDNGVRSGSAYLFDITTGQELMKLLPDDGAVNDVFGWSIAIDAGVVAVGAHGNDDHGSASGSAYLFDATTGDQLFKLTPLDAAKMDIFGFSIAMDNGIVALGAHQNNDNGFHSGSAYLFDVATGDQLRKLLPNDGTRIDSFGQSIAIDGGVVAVGADNDDDAGDFAGSAYLFDAETGSQLFKLLPNDIAPGDAFGYSIDIDNGVVVVGAWLDDDNGALSGSAYLFDVATGSELFKLLPEDSSADQRFGRSVAISDGIAAVGAFRDSSEGVRSGSVYLFDISTGSQIAKLVPGDAGSDDQFGFSLALQEGVGVIGSNLNDLNGPDSGSAYIFGVSQPCLADFSGDGVLDFFDISTFLNAFAAQQSMSDLNGDDVFDFFDISVFLVAYSSGCP